MKRDLFYRGFVAAVVVALWGSWAFAVEFAGGTGEANDPYQIATAQQLCSIGSDPNLLDKCYVLINNIDLDPCLPGGQVFTKAVIAPETSAKIAFSGSFNGQGHKIRGLTINGQKVNGSDPDNELVHRLGLFGGIASQALVTDLSVTDANIVGGDSLGIIAGWSRGNIILCITSGSLSGRGNVGGLIGWNAGAVNRCSSACTVVGEDDSIGGLIGENEGSLTYCTRTNGVTLGGYDVGGLVGRNYGSLSHCQSSGMVRGRLSVGGLVGVTVGTQSSLTNCTSSGMVMTEGHEGYGGGLAGWSRSPVLRCHSNAVVIGKGDVETLGGALGYNSDDTMSCSSAGLVFYTGGDAVCGGFAGINDGYVESSYSLSDVMGINKVGGFMGENGGGEVSNCYSRGSVRGQSQIGGFIAENGGAVANCYCSSPIDGNDTVGGFVASGVWGLILNCFWDTEASGITESDGGIPQTTAQMQDIQTFLDACWDFVDETVNGTEDIWMMPVDPVDYPRLSWEYL